MGHMGTNGLREGIDHLDPEGRVGGWGGVEGFGNLVQVPAQGQQLLIRARQRLAFRLRQTRLLSQIRAEQGNEPSAGQEAVPSGTSREGEMLGGREANFQRAGRAFTARRVGPKGGAGRGGGGRRSGPGPRDGGEELAQRLARRQASGLTPGEPGLFEVLEIDGQERVACLRGIPLSSHVRECSKDGVIQQGPKAISCQHLKHLIMGQTVRREEDRTDNCSQEKSGLMS